MKNEISNYVLKPAPLYNKNSIWASISKRSKTICQPSVAYIAVFLANKWGILFAPDTWENVGPLDLENWAI